MTPIMETKVMTLFIDNVAVAYPDLPYAFSGQANPNESLYARLWILPSEEVVPVGFGRTAKNRTVGIIQIDVMGPKDQGGGKTGDIAFAMGKWFARSDHAAGVEGKITFKESLLKDWGDVGEMHRHTVSIPYEYDYTP